jgi:hypothetical protein
MNHRLVPDNCPGIISWKRGEEAAAVPDRIVAKMRCGEDTVSQNSKSLVFERTLCE